MTNIQQLNIYQDPRKQLDLMIEIYHKWKTDREEYPGWIVCPHDNRRRLFYLTKTIYIENYGSINFEEILSFIKSNNAKNNTINFVPVELLIIYELNWRLEKALVPLFPQWAEIITSVVKKYNPFPHLFTNLIKEEGFINPNNLNYKTLKLTFQKNNKSDIEEFSWEEVKKAWIELCFTLAKHARENGNKKIFDEWMDKLKKIVNFNYQWKARWFYEKCLFYLSHFDEQNLRKTLKEWQSPSQIDFWEVKRASVLAELGEFQEALQIAQEALLNIRRQISSYEKDYMVLSQEGWTMFLIKFLDFQFNGFTQDQKKEIAEFGGRWDQLEGDRCNPHLEMDFVTSFINYPLPKQKKQIQKKRGFFPNTYTETINYSSENYWEIYISTFNFLQIFEQSAIPMRCGMVKTYGSQVANACKSTAYINPFLSISSWLRTGEIKEFSEWLDRLRVKTLSQENIDYLYEVFYQSLHQTIKFYSYNKPLVHTFSERIILTVPVLLSHLAFRLNSQQIEQLFNLSIKIYNLPIFRQNVSYYNSVSELFKGLFYALSDEEKINKINQLLLLPIPNYNGFEIENVNLWKEPFIYLNFSPETKLPSTFNRSNWDEDIKQLIKIVKEDNLEARKRAAWRLASLFSINALSDNEMKLFADSLWSHIDKETQLPSQNVFYLHSYLILPEPKRGLAKQELRQYLLSEKASLPLLSEKASLPFSLNRFSYINNLLSSSCNFLTDEKIKDKFIDWTQGEIEKILNEKIINWWAENKDVIQSNINIYYILFDQNLIIQLIQDILQLISIVILPKIKNSHQKVKEKVIKLLSDFRELNFSITRTLPMSLFIEYATLDQITESLKNSLNSHNEAEFNLAIDAIYYWLLLGQKKEIEECPTSLIELFLNQLCLKTYSGQKQALEMIFNIIEKLDYLLTSQHLNILSICVSDLENITQLPSSWVDIDSKKNDPQIIRLEELIDYRELIEKLKNKLSILSNPKKS